MESRVLDGRGDQLEAASFRAIGLGDDEVNAETRFHQLFERGNGEARGAAENQIEGHGVIWQYGVIWQLGNEHLGWHCLGGAELTSGARPEGKAGFEVPLFNCQITQLQSLYHSPAFISLRILRFMRSRLS